MIRIQEPKAKMSAEIAGISCKCLKGDLGYAWSSDVKWQPDVGLEGRILATLHMHSWP